jgi:hypothetical protein
MDILQYLPAARIGLGEAIHAINILPGRHDVSALRAAETRISASAREIVRLRDGVAVEEDVPSLVAELTAPLGG